MSKKQLCIFGENIEHKLVDIRQTDKWLIEQVAKRTGKYFDRSYLHKIKTGQIATPGIVTAISHILEIDQPNEKEATAS